MTPDLEQREWEERAKVIKQQQAEVERLKRQRKAEQKVQVREGWGVQTGMCVCGGGGS